MQAVHRTQLLNLIRFQDLWPWSLYTVYNIPIRLLTVWCSKWWFLGKNKKILSTFYSMCYRHKDGCRLHRTDRAQPQTKHRSFQVKDNLHNSPTMTSSSSTCSPYSHPKHNSFQLKLLFMSDRILHHNYSVSVSDYKEKPTLSCSHSQWCRGRCSFILSLSLAWSKLYCLGIFGKQTLSWIIYKVGIPHIPSADPKGE